MKWLAPTDTFLEFGAEAGNGGAYPGTRLSRNGLNGVALFAHVGGDIGDSIGWRAGLSWLDQDAEDRELRRRGQPRPRRSSNAFTGSSSTWVADATLKWAPARRHRRRILKLQGEYMRRTEDGALAFDVDGRGP